MDFEPILVLVVTVIAVGVLLAWSARLARKRAAALDAQGRNAWKTAVLDQAATTGQQLEALFVGSQPKTIAMFGKVLVIGVIAFVLATLVWVGVLLVQAI